VVAAAQRAVVVLVQEVVVAAQRVVAAVQRMIAVKDEFQKDMPVFQSLSFCVLHLITQDLPLKVDSLFSEKLGFYSVYLISK
jgi:hypothetical protein